ncbi:MAG: hypothetical protein L3J07_00060 [Candidatus Magasanikbacteria bacterium]|nr:hypothetical protein [Candidatus Magasanikbacteria bacterium]
MRICHISIWVLVPKDLFKNPHTTKNLLYFVRNNIQGFSTLKFFRVAKMKTFLTHRLIEEEKGAFERSDMNSIPGSNQEIISFIGSIMESQIEKLEKHPLVVFVDQTIDSDCFG